MHLSAIFAAGEVDLVRKKAMMNDSSKQLVEDDVTVAHPMQPVVMVGEVARFKANPIVEHLLDHGGIDMNALARMNFSREDREHFAQLIGYSVSGFASLSYVSDEVYDKASQAVEALIAKQSGNAS